MKAPCKFVLFPCSKGVLHGSKQSMVAHKGTREGRAAGRRGRSDPVDGRPSRRRQVAAAVAPGTTRARFSR